MKSDVNELHEAARFLSKSNERDFSRNVYTAAGEIHGYRTEPGYIVYCQDDYYEETHVFMSFKVEKTGVGTIGYFICSGEEPVTVFESKKDARRAIRMHGRAFSAGTHDGDPAKSLKVKALQRIEVPE